LRPPQTVGRLRLSSSFFRTSATGARLSPKWYVTPDLGVASDRLVEVVPNLVVVIRTYSAQDPEQMFSVVRIVDVGRR
jgi:type II secretory pathway component PulC